MRFHTLPPLVVILLLVFLWFILLVLLLWFAFRPRRVPEPREATDTRPDPQRRRRPHEETPPPRPVRVVRPQREGDSSSEAHDAFDDFVTGNRRDDFDF